MKFLLCSNKRTGFISFLLIVSLLVTGPTVTGTPSASDFLTVPSLLFLQVQDTAHTTAGIPRVKEPDSLSPIQITKHVFDIKKQVFPAVGMMIFILFIFLTYQNLNPD